MNEEQIKTQEYIFRNREDVPQTKEKKNINFKPVIMTVLGVVAAVAVALVIVTAVKNDRVRVKADTVTENAETAKEQENTLPEQTELAKNEPDLSGEEENETSTDSEEGQRVNSGATEEPDNGTEDTEKTDETENTDTIDEDAAGENIQFAEEGFFSDEGETAIGLVSSTIDIMDFYRADDPELPEYLTRKTNEAFKMNLSQEEIELLMHLVEAEAPAEDIFGKILVANVVFNRVLTEGWANTVTEVIYEKYGKAVQFQATANKVYWNSIVVTDSTREAVMRALSGEDYSDGAIYFYAWKKHPELSPTKGWISAFQYLFQHGGHAFYK